MQYIEKQKEIEHTKAETARLNAEAKLLKQQEKPKKPKGLKKLAKKLIDSRLTYKPIVKKSNVAYTLDVSNPETKDKSRFFKETWEEEKRSLFFS